jgi:hypothetical protein
MKLNKFKSNDKVASAKNCHAIAFMLDGNYLYWI